jgi:hypothetical protein
VPHSSIQSFQRSAINVSSAGLNTIVPATPGYSIVVYQYKLVCAAAVSVTWESSGGTVLDGPCAFAANGGVSEPANELGHFATAKGEGLSIFLGGAAQVGGHVVWGLL